MLASTSIPPILFESEDPIPIVPRGAPPPHPIPALKLMKYAGSMAKLQSCNFISLSPAFNWPIFANNQPQMQEQGRNCWSDYWKRTIWPVCPNFYSSTGRFPPPPAGWAQNWRENIEYPEPLRGDPRRELISGRPGGESAYRDYQRAMSDRGSGSAIRQNWHSPQNCPMDTDFRLYWWNEQLRTRPRDPMTGAFQDVPIRASEHGGRGGRREEDPDRHLDWNPHGGETLEQARERLGYLQPPRGKPPEPKGYPKLPSYHKAAYHMRDPTRLDQRPDEESLESYYGSFGRFHPKKLKNEAKLQAARLKEAAQR